MDAPTAHQLIRWSQLAKRLAREAGHLVASLQRGISDSDASSDAPNANANTNSDSNGGGGGGGRTVDIASKSNEVDLVTRADVLSQQLIVGGIRSDSGCAGHRVIGEEDAAGDDYAPLGDEATWIVDAIDGTTNYVHGLADYCVSIALCVKRAVVVAAVYAPVHDVMYSAIRGFGAFANDRPLRTTRSVTLQRALVISEWAYVRDQTGVQRILQRNERLLVHGCRAIRQLGSGALDLCYVAANKANATYCGVLPDHADAWKIWDYAAASLVAAEAGAALAQTDGSPFTIDGPSMVCTSNAQVMQQLLPLLR